MVDTLPTSIQIVNKKNILKTHRAPANRSTESVSDEEVWRVRFGVRTAKNLDRLVSESDPEDEAGELDAHRIGETLPM